MKKGREIGFVVYRSESVAFNILDEDYNLQDNTYLLGFEDLQYATSCCRSDERFIRIVTTDGGIYFSQYSLLQIASFRNNYVYTEGYLKINGSTVVNMEYARRFNGPMNIFLDVPEQENVKRKLFPVSRKFQQEVNDYIDCRFLPPFKK